MKKFQAKKKNQPRAKNRAEKKTNHSKLVKDASKPKNK